MQMESGNSELWLIRHGETEWSASGAHTSRTDVPLTVRGKDSAKAIGDWLEEKDFSIVLTSSRQRARETCRIAWYSAAAQVDDNIAEWDYGEYEGRTTPDIRNEQPGWSVWKTPPPGGETLEEIAGRAQKVIGRALSVGGRVALFSHAHFLRILAATWLGLPPEAGRLYFLDTGSVSILSFERETRVIQMWNRTFELR
jgi:probable phosphoglycerate mutase